MTKFLDECACKGSAPKNLDASQGSFRVELLSKMLQNREAVRFLIAPVSFGKTTMALQYSASIFSFEGVWWVEGKSHCFLRDLDSGTMVSSFIERDDLPSLVVFEDVPILNHVRLNKFFMILESLVCHGCEVIVTGIPCGNDYDSYQGASAYIKAQNFIVTFFEAEERGISADYLKGLSPAISLVERIPSVFWGEKHACQDLITSAEKDMLLPSHSLILFAALVLATGTLDDLRIFFGKLNEEVCREFLESYLFIGYDARQEEFSSYPFSLETISSAFKPSLYEMEKTFDLGGASDLVTKLADILLGRNMSERACLFMREFATASQITNWLSIRALDLFKATCFCPVHKLYGGVANLKGKKKDYLLAMDAWSLAMLGELDSALSYAEKVYQNSGSGSEARCLSSLLLIRYGERSLACCAKESLDRAVRFSSLPIEQWISCESSEHFAAENNWWKVLAVGNLILDIDPKKLLVFVKSRIKTNEKRAILSILFIWLVESLYSNKEIIKKDALPILECTEAYLEKREKEKELSVFDCALFEKYKYLKKILFAECVEDEYFFISRAASITKKAIADQKEQVRCYNITKRGSSLENHTASYESVVVPAAQAKKNVPLLDIRLFGGLEVKIAGSVINPKLFSRHKVKTLLGLLVINQGKEISRDKISQSLWPDSFGDAAQQNLYSIWSLLKKALASPEGDCPYLIRTQFSYKIDESSLDSDVAQFDELCRKLLFDELDPEKWENIYERISSLYQGELLPTEATNSLILSARESYQRKFVDTLSTAAARLCKAHEFQTALWYAHAAVSHDTTREDAYVLLMQAQKALGQRTAALETYFTCRKYLSEELGIDPSKNTRLLYESIVTEEA